MYLMSKDIVLAKIDFDKMVFDVYEPRLMPFALRGSGVNLFTVRDWISERVLNISRSNAKVILGSLGLDQNNRIAICYACKALSLTDCYWLKSESDKQSTWNTVNLYKNSLSKSVAHVALTGEYVSIQGRIRTPELTGGGSFAKCWRRGSDCIYLYKASSHGEGKEHLVEVFCSDLLDKLDVNHVKYNMAKSGLRDVSRCKNITDENMSICEMAYFSGFCSRNKIDLQKYLLSQPDYFKMLIVDYIMFNSDRHSGNWGILFDANNGKCLGLHPLFDHNLSLNPDADFKSKVIIGKTLRECAKYAKGHVNLDVKDLKRWLNLKTTSHRLNSIDSSGRWYDSLLERVDDYCSW